jgi:hypothetical protein
MSDIADSQRTHFLSRNNDACGPSSTQAGRLNAHPFSIGNRHLITAIKAWIDLAHLKNLLISIGSSDYDVLAIKIVLMAELDISHLTLLYARMNQGRPEVVSGCHFHLRFSDEEYHNTTRHLDSAPTRGRAPGALSDRRCARGFLEDAGG